MGLLALSLMALTTEYFSANLESQLHGRKSWRVDFLVFPCVRALYPRNGDIEVLNRWHAEGRMKLVNFLKFEFRLRAVSSCGCVALRA